MSTGRLTKEDKDYRKRQCGRKIRYDDYWQARAGADRLEVSRMRPFNVYLCRLCGFYHAGSAIDS